MKQRFDVIAFDNYGTLEDIHTEEEELRVWKTVSSYMRMHGADWTPVTLRKAYRTEVADQLRNRTQTAGEENAEADLGLVFDTLYAVRHASVPAGLVEETALVFRAASMDDFRLYPGTAQMLRTLKKNGLRLALFSNAQILFTRPELTALGIWKLFDRCFISSDFGIKKPSTAFYRQLIDWAAVPPERILMVGNSPRDDILPAAALGISTCYIPSDLTEPGAERPESTLFLPGPDMKSLASLILNPPVPDQ